MTDSTLPPCGIETPKVTPPVSEDEKHWLVRRDTIRKMWRYGLALLLALTVVGEIIHPHPHFEIENQVGFWSWYGFLTCIGMVVFAKGLGYVLKRPDTYYDGPEHGGSN